MILIALLLSSATIVTPVSGFGHDLDKGNAMQLQHFMAPSSHDTTHVDATMSFNAAPASGAAESAPLWSGWFTSTISQGRTRMHELFIAPPSKAVESESAVPDNAPPSKAVESESAVPNNRQQMYFRPVSVTLRVVMTLAIVSLTGYTLLSIGRNADELSASFKPSRFTQILTVTARIGAFAPMLCMLCVACRMYILATTEGLGEPPQWVKACMYAAAGGLCGQILVVLALPAFVDSMGGKEEATYDYTIGKQALSEEEEEHEAIKKEADKLAEMEAKAGPDIAEIAGEQNDVHPIINKQKFRGAVVFMKPIFWVVQMISMLCIYGGIGGIIYGVLTFPAQSTKVSPAVLCTILLSIIYFFVCLLLWIGRTVPLKGLTQSALAMSSVIRKAPMFAVVFLASRMRALNLNPPYGMPPKWMQALFYGITVCMYLEVICAAVVGTIGKKIQGYYGVYLFKCKNKACQIIMHCFALATYIAMVPIVFGIYMMKDADGKEAPLSTTLRCTVVLAGVYFTVMFLQTFIFYILDRQEAKEDDNDTNCKTIIRDSSISAGISLGLAPLLCILFVATRMRALQITQQQGAPPGWAQDCMLIAVFATCVQSICCILMPIFIGKACQVDEDGNPDYDLKPMIGAYAVTIVKYVALFALHGSVLSISAAVFLMTPETAHSGNRFLTSRKAFFEACATTLVIFFVALLLSSAKVIGMAIKLAIEACDKELLGVDITIKKVALSVFKGYVHIQNLKVCQPEFEIKWQKKGGKMIGEQTEPLKKLEWKEDYIFKIRTILVKINLCRLITSFGKVFELQNLTIAGVHANVEKPNAKREMNSNIEYIINHLDKLGLIPPPDAGTDAQAIKDKEKAAKDAEEAANAKKETKEEPQKAAAALDIPQIILHKIDIGDFGAGVTVKEVPVLGTISFHPTISELVFPDIQHDIFDDREDLTPAETVGYLIKALAKKIAKKVFSELPSAIAGGATAGCSSFCRKMSSSSQRSGKALTSHDNDLPSASASQSATSSQCDSPTPREIAT